MTPINHWAAAWMNALPPVSDWIVQGDQATRIGAMYAIGQIRHNNDNSSTPTPNDHETN